ncbi:MAG: hypothetical protein R3E39_22980 [Anaerolineae bacterium]
MNTKHVRFCVVMLLLVTLTWTAAPVRGQDVIVLKVNTDVPRVYEKYEVRFTIPQSAQHPLFAYDDNPPPGVVPRTGITVDGVITTPSGHTVRQPAFFMEDVERGEDGYFQEIGTAAWVLHYSPQEVGQHQVSIEVTSADGTTSAPIGSFSAGEPLSHGFIKVSPDDPRYFEFSDGSLFWPIGPAYSYGNYDQYKDSGLNFDRPWLGGTAAYSSNWARWISTAADFGNEGAGSFLSFREHAPGSDLSYELTYPHAFRYWIPTWLNDDMGPRFKPDTTYRIMIRLKTVGLTGPRDPQYEWGLTARTSQWLGITEPVEVVENTLHDIPPLFPHIHEDSDWFTVEAEYKTNGSPDNDITLYLDNVSGGSAYVDELQVREVLPDGSLGGSVIRSPKADLHTYVDPRGAAKIDWMVEQAEKDGVYLKLVVHDKNDWIQNHLKVDGTFADEGDGYYQPENTKARWLLRQWYRYLIARWGYSTAVHSWELNNEGPPDATENGTALHWETAQAFAQFMHANDAHPHLATTSFWCCWRPEFWGNSARFPDIDYADLHEYTREDPVGADMAAFHLQWSMPLVQDAVDKPVIHAETGITNPGWFDELKQPNPGFWYRHLLWSSLDAGALFEPGYWFAEHLDAIPQIEIAHAFALFVNELDVQNGGYTDLAPVASNASLRVIGQKNITAGKAFGWVQNTNFTWRSALDGYSGSESGSVTFALAAGSYTVYWYSTATGQLERTETSATNGDGDLTLAINDLAEDTAFRIERAG